MATIVPNRIGKVVNVLIDGNVYQKTFEEKEQAEAFFKLALAAKKGGKPELDALMAGLNRMYRTVVDGVLEVDGTGAYYLRGFNVPMPELLVNTFLEYIESEHPVDALVNFWKLLMLNPDKRIRETLFTFLQNYKFAITDNGYFVGYKVVKVFQQPVNRKLKAFVTEKFNRIKQNRKSPKNYSVIHDKTNDKYIVMQAVLNSDSPELNEGLVLIGNLAELMENKSKLSSKTVYTDKWNGTTRIILGETVSKERKFEDHSAECSSNGLHVGSTQYVNSFHSQGDTVLLVLVNPMHVIHVPKGESTKMRTAEYFPYAILSEKEKPENGNRFNVLEQPYFETDYAGIEKDVVEAELIKIIESESTVRPTPEQLDYQALLQSRLVDLNHILNTDSEIDSTDEMPGL